VILIGELRDAETAETALQAAESGHLVLSTLHTVDAAETISRLVEFFPAVKQQMVRSILAGVLRGVVSQRLLPRIGGGRMAAVEVMVSNDRIAELIREDRSDEIPAAIAEGSFYDMRTLSEALIELVIDEYVEREVAASAAPNRHDFLLALDHAQKVRAAEMHEAPAADLRPSEPEPEAEPEPPPLRLVRVPALSPPYGG
jgi:twitching motility protein PilT